MFARNIALQTHTLQCTRHFFFSHLFGQLNIIFLTMFLIVIKYGQEYRDVVGIIFYLIEKVEHG